MEPIMKRGWVWVWMVFFVLGLGACGGGNQSAVEGKLADSHGNPVAGMKITASQEQPLKGYEKLEAVSKSDGTFRITGLFPSSTYILKPVPDNLNAGASVRIQSAPQGATAVVPDPVLVVPAFCTAQRRPATNPDYVYVDFVDGTVTDVRTGLTWKQCAEGLSGATCQNGSEQGFSWADALSHAGRSTFANHTDWRVPSRDELSSLIENCRRFPSINTHRFPNTPHSHFWSGSSDAGNSFSAYAVNFNVGTTHFDVRSRLNRVRLVRGGQ